MMKFKNKLFAVLLCCIFVFSGYTVPETINDTYVGYDFVLDIIAKLKFNDIPTNHFSRENVVRETTLDLIGGYDENFNVDEILIKNATVEKIQDYQVSEDSVYKWERDFYLKSSADDFDIIKYRVESSDKGISTDDVIVFKDGLASGLGALKKGDSIEYLVNEQTKEMIYIRVIGSVSEGEVKLIE